MLELVFKCMQINFRQREGSHMCRLTEASPQSLDHAINKPEAVSCVN